jgi:hypothetical protein
MLKITTVLFLVFFSSLALLHFIALKLFLYWHFPWLDICMHFFGGVIVALGFFTLSDLRLYSSSFLTLTRILLLVFFVAGTWEVFELYAGIPIEDDYIQDTIIDLCMGLLGGAIGFYVAKRLSNNELT